MQCLIQSSRILPSLSYHFIRNTIRMDSTSSIMAAIKADHADINKAYDVCTDLIRELLTEKKRKRFLFVVFFMIELCCSTR